MEYCMLDSLFICVMLHYYSAVARDFRILELLVEIIVYRLGSILIHINIIIDEIYSFLPAFFCTEFLVQQFPEPSYFKRQVKAQWQHLAEPAWDCWRPVDRGINLRCHSPGKPEHIDISS